MAKHVTFRGQTFNMVAFADQHGETRAVGNSGRNARGDIIDKNGNVIATAQQVNAVYNNKNPKAVAKVSITKDPDERLQGQQPKAAGAKPAATAAKPSPAEPKVAPTVAATAAATTEDPSQQVVNRRVFMDANGEEKTEITYQDGSVEVV